MTSRRFLPLVLLASLWSFCSLSFSQVTVTATLTDGTGTVYRTAYLHFQLVNCGQNFPVVTGQEVVVQDSFDLRPATPGGSISATILGNDQITCGGIASTSYLVTPMKDATHPLRDGYAYVICSSTSTLSTCGNSILGIFNLVTALPMTQVPPTPGLIQVYGNPTKTQNLDQPPGTELNFGGTVNFCSATVLCGGGGIPVNQSFYQAMFFGSGTPSTSIGGNGSYYLNLAASPVQLWQNNFNIWGYTGIAINSTLVPHTTNYSVLTSDAQNLLIFNGSNLTATLPSGLPLTNEGFFFLNESSTPLTIAGNGHNIVVNGVTGTSATIPASSFLMVQLNPSSSAYVLNPFLLVMSDAMGDFVSFLNDGISMQATDGSVVSVGNEGTGPLGAFFISNANQTAKIQNLGDSNIAITGNVAISGKAVISGDVVTSDVNGVIRLDNVTYTSVNAAVAACPNPGTVIVDIPGTWPLSGPLNVPSTCSLEVRKGAVINLNGQTLTVGGALTAGAYQIFTGAGSVVFGKVITQAPVEWFGAVGDWNGTAGTDNTAPINACIAAFSFGECTLQAASYKITAALLITKSSVGLTGVGSALFNTALYASVPPSTIIISTSASADIIDVLGASSSQVLGGTILKNLNLERSVIPTGTAKGIDTTYAQGEMYSNIVSQDSIYNFYFRGTGSVGYGFIENCAAQWGFVGVTETTGSLYGFYVDSTSSVASPSLRIRNSFAVSNISSGPTFYGLAAVGNQLSDLHVNHFETAQNMNYGEYLNASNSFILDSFDIHFVDVINDSCATYCLYATGVGGSINITGGESLCTAGCTANYDIESSSNVSIVNHVFYNFGTGDDVLVNNSTNISLLDSTLLGGSNAPIVYNAVSNSHINSVTVTGSLASTGITLTGSSNNTIVGDSIFDATTGISLDATSNNNTGLETLQCTSVSGSCVSDSGGSYYGGGVRQFCGSTGSFAPTISSGFNTGSIGAHTNGTCFFTVTVGSGAAVSTGVIGITSNTNGWVCQATNQNRAALIQQTGSTASTVTFTNFGTTFAATNWTNGDVILVSCGGLH